MTGHGRQKFIIGNWKMHTNSFDARQLAKGVVDGVGSSNRVTIVLCPPFPYLPAVGDVLRGSRIVLGAQNMYPELEGAFTGEVSPTMLIDLGCKYVILGHSERRHELGESDAFINRKVKCALAAGLEVILCVGETLAQREAMQTEGVLDSQLCKGLDEVSPESLLHLSIAYEPVWAIGNANHHATAQQAHDAHLLIRRRLSKIYGETWARELLVHYGGSVDPENAAEFFGQPGIDGVLLGGASLKAEDFLSIVRSAPV